jgi:DNA-binding NarL/FixJ family response regulator
MARHVLLIVPDLFFATRIREAAAALGVSVIETPAADAAATAGALEAAVAIVDLAEGESAAGTVRALREAAPGLRIVGFHSHVDVRAREAALAAGADEVLPRSALTRRLGEVLAGGTGPAR